MPTFKTKRPASLRDSISTLLSSSPRLTESDLRSLDAYSAKQDKDAALAEKARLEVEEERKAARLRSDPNAAADYSSVASGLTTPMGRQLRGYIYGESIPPLTPNDDEGNPLTPAPYERPAAVSPEQERLFRSNLASTIAQNLATGKTNADQLVQAGGHGLTNAIRSEITAARDVEDQNRLKAGISPSYREPYSGGAPHGVAVNQETGEATVVDQPLHDATVRAQTALATQRDPSRGIPPQQPSGEAPKTGDEYLATLPAGTRETIKAVAEGRTPLTNFSTKGGHREQILAMVMQYDPTYNATRSNTWREFTTGGTARNITSINTAIGHMGTMLDLADALKNNDTRVVNVVLNRIATETGKQNVNNFETARQAVGEELMRTFRQVGASEVEAAQWGQRFNSANSPEQLKGAIKTAADLLQSRIEAVNEMWRRGTQRNEDFPNILSGKSKTVMQRLEAFGAGMPPVNGKGWKLMVDGRGRRAYVSPDGKQFEEVK